MTNCQKRKALLFRKGALTYSRWYLKMEVSLIQREVWWGGNLWFPSGAPNWNAVACCHVHVGHFFLARRLIDVQTSSHQHIQRNRNWKILCLLFSGRKLCIGRRKPRASMWFCLLSCHAEALSPLSPFNVPSRCKWHTSGTGSLWKQNKRTEWLILT
jgi:hypothetical protein